jgi:hypothetical protein
MDITKEIGIPSKLSFFGFLTLEMGPIGCHDTSVRNYHYSLRNDPEKRSVQNVT